MRNFFENNKLTTICGICLKKCTKLGYRSSKPILEDLNIFFCSNCNMMYILYYFRIFDYKKCNYYIFDPKLVSNKNWTGVKSKEDQNKIIPFEYLDDLKEEINKRIITSVQRIYFLSLVKFFKSLSEENSDLEFNRKVGENFNSFFQSFEDILSESISYSERDNPDYPIQKYFENYFGLFRLSDDEEARTKYWTFTFQRVMSFYTRNFTKQHENYKGDKTNKHKSFFQLKFPPITKIVLFNNSYFMEELFRPKLNIVRKMKHEDWFELFINPHLERNTVFSDNIDRLMSNFRDFVQTNFNNSEKAISFLNSIDVNKQSENNQTRLIKDSLKVLWGNFEIPSASSNIESFEKMNQIVQEEQDEFIYKYLKWEFELFSSIFNFKVWLTGLREKEERRRSRRQIIAILNNSRYSYDSKRKIGKFPRPLKQYNLNNFIKILQKSIWESSAKDYHIFVNNFIVLFRRIIFLYPFKFDIKLNVDFSFPDKYRNLFINLVADTQRRYKEFYFLLTLKTKILIDEEEKIRWKTLITNLYNESEIISEIGKFLLENDKKLKPYIKENLTILIHWFENLNK